MKAAGKNEGKTGRWILTLWLLYEESVKPYVVGGKYSSVHVNKTLYVGEGTFMGYI